MDEQSEFLDAENFSGGGSVETFQQLVFQQLQRILRQGSQEFCGGWWLKVEKKDTTIQRYVEDTRSAYINGVQSLYDLIEPYFENDIKSKKNVIKPLLESWNNELESFDKSFSEKNKSNNSEETRKKLKEEYLNTKAELFRKLFRILSGLIKRQNNFSESRGRGK